MEFEVREDEEWERQMIKPQLVDTRPASERTLVLGCPRQIGGTDSIDWGRWRPDIPEKFATALAEASDEKPLQRFFEEHPVALLTSLVSPHTGWVIPRPRLPKPDGGLWIPDFIVCEWSSVGPDWFIVELESPTQSPLTKAGIPKSAITLSSKSMTIGRISSSMAISCVKKAGPNFTVSAKAWLLSGEEPTTADRKPATT